MYEKRVGYFKFKKIVNESHNYIYHDKETDMMFKLDKGATREMLERHMVSIFSSSINTEQIATLADKQQFIQNSYLPFGVLTWRNLPVATIYPFYFEGYKTFEELHNEESDLIINNLKQAYYNNIELIHNDICNKDFAFKNIMYNDDKVELIDLDGKYIGNSRNSTYLQLYQDFIYGMQVSIKRKLDLLYKEDSNKVFNEIRPLFAFPDTGITEDYPLKVIEEIERQRILK